MEDFKFALRADDALRGLWERVVVQPPHLAGGEGAGGYGVGVATFGGGARESQEDGRVGVDARVVFLDGGLDGWWLSGGRGVGRVEALETPVDGVDAEFEEGAACCEGVFFAVEGGGGEGGEG